MLSLTEFVQRIFVNVPHDFENKPINRSVDAFQRLLDGVIRDLGGRHPVEQVRFTLFEIHFQTLSFLYQARIHPLEQRRLFVYFRPLIARLCGLHLALTGLSTRRDTCLSITWLVSKLAVNCWLEKHDENIEGLAWWCVLMPLWCGKDAVFPSVMCSSVSQLLSQLRY